MSTHLAGEVAEHDAAVEDIYRQLDAKTSKTSLRKSKKTVRAEEA